MKRIFVTVIFFLLFGSALYAQTGTWTLQQCIDSAVSRNFQIKQRGLQVETAAVNYSQAKGSRLPGISADVNHGIQQGRSIDPFTNAYVNQKINYAGYGAGGELTLFNGLSLKNNIRQYKYATDAARMDEQQEKDDITLNVILAYLQVLNNEDLTAISKAQLAVTQIQVDRLEKLNKEGAIAPPLLFDLRGQLKGEELSVVNAANAVETAKLALSQLMNMPYDPAMKVARDGTETTMNQYAATALAVYQNAVSKFAVVQAAELRKQSAEASVKVARGLLYPSFLLNGNINSNYSSVARKNNLINATDVATDSYVFINGSKSPVMATQNNYTSEKISYPDQIKNNIYTNVGVTMRVPLLNGLQTRNRIKLAQINVKSAALVEENTKLLLRQAIDQAYLNMTNSWSRYNVLLEQVAAYGEAFRAAEVRFNEGVGTSVDYTLAKSKLDNANLNLVVAKYDYLLRKKVLDYYSGKQ